MPAKLAEHTFRSLQALCETQQREFERLFSSTVATELGRLSSFLQQASLDFFL
jgi:hypothetical protein